MAEVREARRLARDSTETVVASYVNGSGAFNPEKQPVLYTTGLVRSRRTHVEDWIAFLVANHLFAGADAYVAANLWDVPAQLAIRPTTRGAAIVASLSW